MTQDTIEESHTQLSPRELEVVEGLAQGHTYAQIADQLGVTENTLKTYIKRVYSKLNVHNRTQAVLETQKLQLLE